MEPLENLFSSPAKSDHEEEQAEASDDYGSGEEAMDITTSTQPAVGSRNNEECRALTWL
jgi:hypothetical protein